MKILELVFGFGSFISASGLLVFLVRAMTLSVEDETTVLVLRFGKLVRTLTRPGLCWLPERVLPWVKLLPVSLQSDFRTYREIHVNDRHGTTVVVDLWLEFKIKDPAKAVFQVEDWEMVLQSLVTHAATSILGSKDFSEILCDRNELSSRLQEEIAAETQRWGIEIQTALIQNVGLTPELSRRMFDSVAARIERAKALIEENGRLKIAQLDADTHAEIAEMRARAKTQYPLAVGRAYGALASKPKILEAYEELYRLSLVQTGKTIFFDGFSGEEVSALDSVMATASLPSLSVSPGAMD